MGGACSRWRRCRRRGSILKALKPTGYVNDFAGALDASSKQTLEAYCANLERSPACRWRSCWCNTLDGEPIEDVANRLYRQWGIGKKGKDEGILLLLAVKDRKSRAEIGYGAGAHHHRWRAGRHSAPDPADSAAGQLRRRAAGRGRADGHHDRAIKGVELGGAGAGAPNAARPARRPSIPFPLILLGLFFLLWLLGAAAAEAAAAPVSLPE